MGGGAIVIGQEHRFRRIVSLEAADEFNRGAVEGVDVLVVVPHRERAEPAIFLL